VTALDAGTGTSCWTVRFPRTGRGGAGDDPRTALTPAVTDRGVYAKVGRPGAADRVVSVADRGGRS
jgi:hypothetical protein